MKPFTISLVVFLAIIGLALILLGSGVRDWRIYAALFLTPTGVWLVAYGYIYARNEFYYYGGWGAILILGSMTAGLTPVIGAIRAVGLSILILAVIIALIQVFRR